VSNSDFKATDGAVVIRPISPGDVPAVATFLHAELNGRLSEPDVIDSCLKGRDLEIYRDHVRAPAAHHLVVLRGDQHCYLMFRRDRRKQLPLFASILHVGNPEFFQRVARHVYSCLLTRFGIVATLIENRQGVSPPALSIALRSPRPKMFRSSRLASTEVDYLYSELTCVPW
jgi:hypothetical protein